MRSLALKLNKTLAIVLGLLVVAVVGALAFVWSGVYNIAASSPHTQAVYSLLQTTMQQSVRLRARNIEPPALDAPGVFERGAACYQHRCQLCHGGPSVAQDDIALGMQPLPGPLVDANLRWKARELYWITRNGITMSGMPAWKLQLADGDIWALVAFVQKLPQLSPSEYRQLMASKRGERCGIDEALSAGSQPGDAKRGRAALSQYGCNGCHRIPGITGAAGRCGPAPCGHCASPTDCGPDCQHAGSDGALDTQSSER